MRKFTTRFGRHASDLLNSNENNKFDHARRTMRYVGNRNGTYVILILGQDANDTSVVSRVSCQAPCEFAKSETVSGDTVIRTETLRVTPDSLVGGMLADAVSGQLMLTGTPSLSRRLPPNQRRLLCKFPRQLRFLHRTSRHHLRGPRAATGHCNRPVSIAIRPDLFRSI